MFQNIQSGEDLALSFWVIFSEDSLFFNQAIIRAYLPKTSHNTPVGKLAYMFKYARTGHLDQKRHNLSKNLYITDGDGKTIEPANATPQLIQFHGRALLDELFIHVEKELPLIEDIFGGKPFRVKLSDFAPRLIHTICKRNDGTEELIISDGVSIY